ncbi:MAG: hypothetical protein WAL14_03655 [Pseudolabrys sp.]
MPALVAGIHVLAEQQQVKTWMASEVGLARLPHISGDEPGHDD